MKNTKRLFLSLGVLVCGWGWTVQAEATTVGSLSATRPHLYSLFNHFGGSLVPDVWNGFLEEAQVRVNFDSSAGANRLVNNKTVYPPYTRFRGGKIVPPLEVATVGSSATTIVNTNAGWTQGLHDNGISPRNGVATVRNPSAGGTVFDDGGAWRVSSSGLGIAIILWDINFFDGPGKTDNFATLVGPALWDNFFGLSKGKTQLWPENRVPFPSMMIWFGAGVAGVLGWRIKRAQV